MDLNELYVFSKVVELKSFTKASAFLGIPKSRISRKVASLERELGVQLLYRTTRKLELTPLGKIYFQKCFSIMSDIDSLNAEITSMSDEISGNICITAPEDIARRFFPKVVDEFLEMYPKIKFDFYLTGRRVDLITEPVDLALRIGKLQDSSLKSKKVGEVFHVVCVGANFLHLNQNPADIYDLLKLPAIGFGELSNTSDWVLTNGKKEVRIRPNCCITTNSMDTLIELVINNKGVGLIPSFVARELILKGQLVQLFKSYQTTPVPVHFLLAPQKEIPTKVKRFMDFLYLKLKDRFN